MLSTFSRSLFSLATAFSLASILSVTTATAGVPHSAAMDWPYWRGPSMNSTSHETGIVDRWSPDENVLWMNQDAGGRSTPIVMKGRVYVLTRDQAETPKEGEKVLCLDAKTGEKLWENRFNVYLSDVPDTRVGWSSVVGDPETDRVYALGVCGYFQCLDAKTGETIWSRSMFEEYGLLSTYGGRTNFPIIHGDLVIISAVIIGWGEMAKPGHRFIAFDKTNGQTVWFSGTRPLPYDTTYSAPVLATINGQDQLIFGSGDGGIHAFQPQTGRNIWTYNVSARGINTSPTVVGNTVYAGHSEENIDDTKMGALFAIDATKSGNITSTGEIWRKKEWFVGKSAPIYIDGRIYACEDTGTMLIVDAKTGEEIDTVKLGGPIRNTPLYVDGKLFVVTENGRWWTFKPSDEGVETVYRARMRLGTVSASPIVSHGRLYVQTSDGLYCIGTEGQTPSVDGSAETTQAAATVTDTKPAHVQVVPVETLLRSGDKAQRQKFQVRLYNAIGQYLKTVPGSEVEFAVDGPGQVNGNGRYQAPTDAVHGAATVTARYGTLSGTARVRVMPPLPWSFDFSSGEVPVSWVGVRYRHVTVDFDYFSQLESEDPLASQLYLYLQTEFTNLGTDQLKLDDSTPRATWTKLLIFLGKTESVLTVADAKAQLDASLKRLQDDGFLASWSFSEWKNDTSSGVRGQFARGDRAMDGNVAVVKIKTIPKGTRSQGTIGPPDLSNYTIQGDFRAAIKDNKLPDMGLIAQRYTIDLRGASQELQIRTWPPQLRMAQTIPFEWEPNTWYTLKMQASVENGQAVLRGKAWKRGTEEPVQWQLEATDPVPNVNGSPGLFGNATDAEVFIDNIKVWSN